MTKGDCIEIPLFINRGTALEPIRYAFIQDKLELQVYDKEVPAGQDRLKATVDQTMFRSKVSESGRYFFCREETSWTLSGQEVDIAEYGFTITQGIPAEGDKLEVNYGKAVGNQVTLFIYDPDHKDPVLKKIFKDNGSIKTYRFHDDPITIEGQTISNENDDVILRLDHDDTARFKEQKYFYQIESKLLDRENPIITVNGKNTLNYITKKITKLLPLYIIIDNFQPRDWENA